MLQRRQRRQTAASEQKSTPSTVVTGTTLSIYRTKHQRFHAFNDSENHSFHNPHFMDSENIFKILLRDSNSVVFEVSVVYKITWQLRYTGLLRHLIELWMDYRSTNLWAISYYHQYILPRCRLRYKFHCIVECRRLVCDKVFDKLWAAKTMWLVAVYNVRVCSLYYLKWRHLVNLLRCTWWCSNETQT